jgi:hypothetical protein
MTRVCALLLSCLFALALPACGPSQATAPVEESAAVARTESEFGSLELSLGRIELRTVDTLEVSIRLEREPGVTAGELVFDPESAGWTVINRSPPQTRLLESGELETRWRFTLEPFLEGAYQIPPVGIELQPPEHEAVKLVTPPQGVTVTSVLEDEKAELAPPRALIEPEPASDRRPYWFAAGIAVSLLVVLAAVLVTRRMGRRGSEPIEAVETLDARAQARLIHQRLADGVARFCSNGKPAQTTEDLVALITGCREIRDSAAWVDLLHQLDSAIYGPTPPVPADLTTLERRAATLLGAVEMDEPEGGGM